MKRSWAVLLLALSLHALPGCSDLGTGVKYLTEPIAENYSSISDPYQRWQAYHLSSYVIEERFDAFSPDAGVVCRVYVRDGTIVEVLKKRDGQPVAGVHPYKTIEELFALARAYPDSGFEVAVQYDERFGFPTSLSVNPRAQIYDAGFGYSAGNIMHLVR